MTARKRCLCVAGILGSLALAPMIGEPAGASEALYHEPKPLCTLLPKLASPELALTGDLVTASLSVSAKCRGLAFRTVMVFVFVEPESWDGDTRNDIARFARRLTDSLPDNPGIHIGAVSVVGGTTARCSPTNESAKAAACIDRGIGQRPFGRARPNTHAVALGLGEAHQLLRLGRRGPDHPETQPREAVVLFTSETATEPCADGVRAAQALKRDGILVAVGLVQGDALRSLQRCGRRLAANDRYVFVGPDFVGLTSFFERIRQDIISVFLRYLEVSWRMSSSMELVNAEPAATSTDGRLMRWQTTYLPSDGITLTLTLKGTQPGESPLAETIELVGVDNKSGRVTEQLRPPSVWLFGQP